MAELLVLLTDRGQLPVALRGQVGGAAAGAEHELEGVGQAHALVAVLVVGDGDVRRRERVR